MSNDNAWVAAGLPISVYNTAAASGTHQTTTASHVGKLHVLVASEDLRLAGGTGAVVDASTGLIWPAKAPFYYRPTQGQESIGWACHSAGSSDVTIALVES